MCLHPKALRKPVFAGRGLGMISRFAAVLASLTLAGILTDASAFAQHYPSNPPVYRGQGPYPYRGAQPYPDDERAYFDDDDDAPMPRSPGVPRTVQQMPQQYQQAPQYQQQPQRGPQRVLPYP